MHLSIEKATITITDKEAYELYRSLRAAIEHSIKIYWRHHPESYPKDEQPRLSMMKELSRITGNNYQHDLLQLQELLEEKEA